MKRSPFLLARCAASVVASFSLGERGGPRDAPPERCRASAIAKMDALFLRAANFYLQAMNLDVQRFV
jgi:hypothetical protein